MQTLDKFKSFRSVWNALKTNSTIIAILKTLIICYKIAFMFIIN
jgi:hypothetical protein